MENLTNEEHTQMSKGEKIAAIKSVRARLNLGLKEAKDLVEYWYPCTPVSSYVPPPDPPKSVERQNVYVPHHGRRAKFVVVSIVDYNNKELARWSFPKRNTTEIVATLLTARDIPNGYVRITEEVLLNDPYEVRVDSRS